MAAGRTHVKVPKASTSATMIRRKPAMYRRRSESLEHVPSIVYDVLREPGKPLDSATRSAAGERLGFSFENVRVHDDLRAAASAEAICAQAYTVGGHVIFGRNRYAPHSAVGRELLYHELCHVAQQGAQTPGVPAQSLELGRTDSPQESHAEAMAAAAAHGDGHGGRLGATSQPAPALPGHVIARTESSEPDPEALAELIRHAQQQQAASPAPAAAIRPWS